MAKSRNRHTTHVEKKSKKWRGSEPTLWKKNRKKTACLRLETGTHTSCNRNRKKKARATGVRSVPTGYIYIYIIANMALL